MSLSVAIAVHNEEKNIERCLKSVYDWVDEIVVVDGASTDDTLKKIGKLEINISRCHDRRESRTARNAESTGWDEGGTESADFHKPAKIKMILTNNPSMFHKNKQKALDACTKKWILQLDADEVITNDLKNEIHSIVIFSKQAPSDKQISNSKSQKIVEEEQQPIAFWIPRLNYFLGRPLRKGGQYPDYTLRLYKNGAAHFPCKDVHENVEINSTGVTTGGSPGQRATQRALDGTREGQAPLNIEYLSYPLLHYPYPTFAEYMKKWRRYCRLEAVILYKQSVRPSFINTLKYLVYYPTLWFFKTYIRHKGFMDGWAGFVFSLFSALRYWGIYRILFKMSVSKKNKE